MGVVRQVRRLYRGLVGGQPTGRSSPTCQTAIRIRERGRSFLSPVVIVLYPAR